MSEFVDYANPYDTYPPGFRARRGLNWGVIGLLYAFIPNVSSVYWIFSVMTTQVYLIMYVLMFIAAVRLRRSQPDHPRGYRAPALRTWSWIGGIASVLAILIGFVPPSQFGHTSPVVYGGLILLGFSVEQEKIAVKPPIDAEEIARAIAARAEARKAKNFRESDRIRDELLAKGVVLKDSPTGTTWEVKR